MTSPPPPVTQQTTTTTTTVPTARRTGRASRRFFLVLLVGTALASAVLFRPLLPVLLFGGVLASALSPLYEALAKRIGRRQIAAVLFAFAFVVVIVAPITAATLSVAGDLTTSAQTLGAHVAKEGVSGLVERLPEPVQRAMNQLGLDGESLQARLSSLAGGVVNAGGAVLKATGLLLFSLTVLVIALVVFLVEGRAISAWLIETVPLERRQTAELCEEFHKISVSVVLGNFGTALAQGLVGLVGYLIAGVPSPLVFALFTFVFSLVPAVGGAAVGLVAAAAVFVVHGVCWQAIFLIAWALVVVGTVDNIVKPLLVKRGIEMHGAIVFFAILSGMAAFGAAGLLIGPFVVGYALTLVRIYRRDFRGTLDPPTTTTTTTTTAPAPPTTTRLATT